MREPTAPTLMGMVLGGMRGSPSFSIPTVENFMTGTKTILLAQALISFMMALLMTGLFNLLALGPSVEWLNSWSHDFIMAWPVAFCLSLIVSKIAFGIAGRLTAS